MVTNNKERTECDLLIYKCTMCPVEKDERRHFVIDCPRWSKTGFSVLFAGAIGMAMTHRGEPHR